MYMASEMEKNERERRSFTFSSVQFSSVQFMNLAQILGSFKFMNVSERGSYYWPRSRSFTFILRSFTCPQCKKKSGIIVVLFAMSLFI